MSLELVVGSALTAQVGEAGKLGWYGDALPAWQAIVLSSNHSPRILQT